VASEPLVWQKAAVVELWTAKFDVCMLRSKSCGCLEEETQHLVHDSFEKKKKKKTEPRTLVFIPNKCSHLASNYQQCKISISTIKASTLDLRKTSDFCFRKACYHKNAFHENMSGLEILYTDQHPQKLHRLAKRCI
jgi:hypothetical protein